MFRSNNNVNMILRPLEISRALDCEPNVLRFPFNLNLKQPLNKEIEMKLGNKDRYKQTDKSYFLLDFSTSFLTAKLSQNRVNFFVKFTDPEVLFKFTRLKHH